MYTRDIDARQLEINIHHVGGIGGYGPTESLGALGHVNWTIYDASEQALADADKPPGGSYSLVNACIGATVGRAEFYVTRAASASSMLKPASSAADYTYMHRDGVVCHWGPHTEIQETLVVDVDTIDALVAGNAVRPVDVLSIDVQGAELSVIRGASNAIGRVTTGVVCEVGFSPYYEGQPLFDEIHTHLRGKSFRLAEIYSPQYHNVALLPADLLGRGFLTVGEALFLREQGFWLGRNESAERLSMDAVVQAVKLAGVAVAFGQLDYALLICRALEDRKAVDLGDLSDLTSVKYVKLLRDLVRNAAQIEQRSPPPTLLHLRDESQAREPRDRYQSQRPNRLRSWLRAMESVVPGATPLRRKIQGKSRRDSRGRRDSMDEILRAYGLRRLAGAKRRFGDPPRK